MSGPLPRRRLARPRLVALAALGLAGAAAAERVVDYAITEAKAAQDAAEQGVPLAPLPARGPHHLAVQVAPAVDHDVVRGGVYCSHWQVSNPMAPLVTRFLAARDRDGAPAVPGAPGVDLTVTVARAATLSRCVGTTQFKAKCITRVSITGTVADAAGATRPFRAEQEQTANLVGLCAGLTRGIGLASRAAAAAMVEAVDPAVPPPPAPGT